MQTTLVNNPSGAVMAINSRKLERFPFGLVTNSPDASVSLIAYGANGPISMSISGEGSAEVFAFGMQNTGACRIKLSLMDGQQLRALSNAALNASTIFGDGLTPYPLPEPLLVDALRRIVVEYVNLSGSVNAVRIFGLSRRNGKSHNDENLKIARKKQAPQEFLSLPYFYTFDAGVAVLTANQTAEFVMTIGHDNHFLMSQISGVSTGLYDLNIVDVATGESIMNAPQGANYGLSSGLIVGSANYPFCLTEPRLFQIGQKILCRLTDKSAASNTIYLTFGGRAIADRMWR